jgi:hypothetical protein
LFSLDGMRTRTKARLLALLISSVLLSLVMYSVLYSYVVSKGAMGKQAYLQSEERRFDILYSQPRVFLTARSIVTACIWPCFGAVASIALYELLALGIYKVIGPDKTERDGTPAI